MPLGYEFPKPASYFLEVCNLPFLFLTAAAARDLHERLDSENPSGDFDIKGQSNHISSGKTLMLNLIIACSLVALMLAIAKGIVLDAGKVVCYTIHVWKC